MNAESQPQETKIGRPSDYSDGLADAICSRIANGESLRSICADEAMPCKSTIMNWLAKDAAFLDQYGRAREAQTHLMAEDALEIADDDSEDTIIGENGPRPNAEWIGRSRLRVETRLKLMALLNPKKYGKRVALEVKDDRTPRQLTDAELAEIAAADE